MKLQWLGQEQPVCFDKTGALGFFYDCEVIGGACACEKNWVKIGGAAALGVAALWLVFQSAPQLLRSNPTLVPTSRAKSDRKQFTDSLPDIISKGDVLTLSSEKKVVARRIVGRGTRVEVYDEEQDDVYIVPLKHVIGVSFR